MNDERVSKEQKLAAAREIVANYVRNAEIKDGEKTRPALTPDEVCQFFRQMYSTIEEVVPEAAPRRVGLGS